MFAHWTTIIRPLIDAARPAVIVEVGSERGDTTRAILEHTSADTILHSIDPAPLFDASDMAAEFGKRLHLHRALSLNALGNLPEADLVLIDGDHNWFTVHEELRLIERTAATADRQPPIVALHDVGWPYGRRDMYYDPETIPLGYRFPAERKGMLAGQGELLDAGGFNRSMCNGIYEGVERCGVLTAVEDFMRESNVAWRLALLPGMHGIGILVAAEVAAASHDVEEFIERLETRESLVAQCQQVELQRIAALIRVTDLTGTVNGALKERDQAREALAASRTEVEELAKKQSQLEADGAAAQAEVDAGRHAAQATRQQAERLAADATAAGQARAEAERSHVEATQIMESERDTALAALAGARAELDELVAVRESLVMARAEAERSHGEATHLAERERDVALAALSNAQAEVDELRAARERLVKDLAEAQDETVAVRHELVTVRQDAERLSREAAAAAQDGERLSAEVVAAAREVECARAEAESARVRLGEVAQERDSALHDAVRSGEERAMLGRKLHSARALRRTLEERLAVARDENRYERERLRIEREDSAHAQRAVERLEAMLELGAG